MRSSLIFIFFLIVATPAPAQVERYDTGRKLIAFEIAWDAQPDAAARKRTLPHLKTALTNFFAGRFGEAAGHIDAARHALTSAEPFKAGPQDKFVLHPNTRFIEKSEPKLT